MTDPIRVALGSIGDALEASCHIAECGDHPAHLLGAEKKARTAVPALDSLLAVLAHLKAERDERIAEMEAVGLPVDAPLSALVRHHRNNAATAAGIDAYVQHLKAECDAWYVETLPSGEGIKELRKAREGKPLDQWEVLPALRAAMEVADAAKRRGQAAEERVARLEAVAEAARKLADDAICRRFTVSPCSERPEIPEEQWCVTCQAVAALRVALGRVK